MEKKRSTLIWIIIILLIIFGLMLYLYLKPVDNNSNKTLDNIRKVEVETGDVEKSITGSRRNIV